jgi:hypothetical protein
MRLFYPVLALLCLSPIVRSQCGDDVFEDNDTISTAVAITPGSHTGLVVTSSQSACGVDEDFYRIIVQDGDVMTVDLAFDTDQGNIGLLVYDKITDYPNNWVARSTSASNDFENVWVPNHTGGPVTYYLFVDIVNAFDTNTYTMDINTFADPCIGLAGDSLEPNDNCAGAVPVTTGLHSGLNLSETNWDYYSIDLPPDMSIRVDLLFTHDPIANVGLTLQGGCTSALKTSFSSTDNENVVHTNDSGSTESLVIVALVTTGSFGVCADYDMLIDIVPNPCLTLGADEFEDNDECGDAVLMGPGTYGGLTVSRGDIDAYRVLVPSGETVTVDLLFSHAQGNIDARSFDFGLECTHIINEMAFTITDDETLSVANLSGFDEEYFLEVFMTTNGLGSTFDCNTYTMVIHVTGQSGNSFCDASDGALASCPCGNPGAPDSGCDIAQGTGGIELDVLAQETTPLNRATLQGTGYPAMSFPGVTVIRSPALDGGSPVVFGDGLRCIGLPVVRVGAALAAGGTSTQTVGHGAGPGSGTFYYQLWVRNTPIMFCDPAAAFNLSNGRTLVW